VVSGSTPEIERTVIDRPLRPLDGRQLPAKPSWRQCPLQTAPARRHSLGQIDSMHDSDLGSEHSKPFSKFFEAASGQVLRRQRTRTSFSGSASEPLHHPADQEPETEPKYPSEDT
jgi:hypothetical protein